MKFIITYEKCFAGHSVSILQCQLLGTWDTRLRRLKTAHIRELKNLFQQINIDNEKEKEREGKNTERRKKWNQKKKKKFPENLQNKKFEIQCPKLRRWI